VAGARQVSGCHQAYALLCIGHVGFAVSVWIGTEGVVGFLVILGVRARFVCVGGVLEG